MTPQEEARCAAYKQLMEEYCTKPPKGTFPRHVDYFLAVGYIADGKPDMAKYHVIHAGVPVKLVVAVDALVSG